MLLEEAKAKLALYPIDIVTRTDYAVKTSQILQTLDVGW